MAQTYENSLINVHVSRANIYRAISAVKEAYLIRCLWHVATIALSNWTNGRYGLCSLGLSRFINTLRSMYTWHTCDWKSSLLIPTHEVPKPPRREYPLTPTTVELCICRGGCTLLGHILASAPRTSSTMHLHPSAQASFSCLAETLYLVDEAVKHGRAKWMHFSSEWSILNA